MFLLAACAGTKKGVYPDSELLTGMEKGVYPDSESLSCTEESGLKSENGDTATRIFLSNQSDETVVVRWINYDGVRDTSLEQKITLKPRRWVERYTYLTHPFVFNDLEGNCLAIFRPRSINTAAVYE